MVRVGGGWDTLQGFLLKYDPCRILQFATLEQKILAFQKGVSNESVPDSPARTPQPPEMNPLSAVNMFQKQNLKPGTPVSVPKSKEKQVHRPGACLPASSVKGNLASPSTRSKCPDSPASLLHPKVTSLKGIAKKANAPSNSASSSLTSLNPAAKPSTAKCASESGRKCVTFPKTAQTKTVPAQNSRDPSKSRLLPSKPPGNIEPKRLKHNLLSSRGESSTCPKLPKGSMQGRPNLSPFQSPAKVTKPSSKTRAIGLGTQSQPPDRTLKSEATSAPRHQSTLNLNNPASVCSGSSANTTQESKGKSTVSVARKPPQSKGVCQNLGPSPSKSPGRTPLSIVTVPQSAAKSETVSK